MSIETTQGRWLWFIRPCQAWLNAIRATISRVALHLRFTAQAAEFLTACLKMVLEYCVSPAAITPSALDAFEQVLIFDSSG